MSEESADVDLSVVEDFKSRIGEILVDYDPTDVFNCDETGLFYRALPDKTLALKGDKVKGGKQSKERLTVLLACSSTGEKLQPLVIGKSQNPRAFKGIDVNQLRVRWRFNKKAWMTGLIFKEWLKNLDLKMRLRKRKILLLMDNCSSHACKDVEMNNVVVKFLPANMTSWLQPLDAGIIKNFKMHFRKLLLQHIVARIDSCASATELTKQLNVLHAVNWIARSWDSVSATTISSCSARCGLQWNDPPADLSSDETYTVEGEVQDLLETANSLGMPVDLSAEEYVSAEKNVPIESSDGWEDQLLEEFRQSMADEHEELPSDPNCQDCESDEESDQEVESVSPQEAIQCLEKVHSYFTCHNADKVVAVNQLLQSIESDVVKQKQQSTLDKYFKTQ